MFDLARLNVSRNTRHRLDDVLDERLRRVNDATIDLACMMPEKMDLLRRIAAAGEEVRDVDVVAPSLDEIYRHFSDAEVRS